MYEDILLALSARRGKFRQIALNTGLSYDWLHQVQNGVIKDPGIKKMQILKDYLISSAPVPPESLDQELTDDAKKLTDSVE